MALTLIQVKQQTWQARYASLTCLQGLSFKFKCACVVWSLFVFINHNPTILLQKFLFGYFAKVVVASQCWPWKDKIGPTFYVLDIYGVVAHIGTKRGNKLLYIYIVFTLSSISSFLNHYFLMFQVFSNVLLIKS